MVKGLLSCGDHSSKNTDDDIVKRILKNWRNYVTRTSMTAYQTKRAGRRPTTSLRQEVFVVHVGSCDGERARRARRDVKVSRVVIGILKRLDI
jgi:hypothetical protein